MIKTNPKVDSYINRSAGFAQPILIHLRKLIHEVCPEVEEQIKWGMPSFEYQGLFCGFASFKQHCTFGFWKASLMKSATLIKNKKEKEAMGILGRITALQDLPSDKILKTWLKEAMKLNELGIVKLKKDIVAKKKKLIAPDYFTKALLKNKKALLTFEQFSYSAKKEYVEWVDEAKMETTRKNRLEQAIVWMAEGKPRNWKYMKKFNT